MRASIVPARGCANLRFTSRLIVCLFETRERFWITVPDWAGARGATALQQCSLRHPGSSPPRATVHGRMKTNNRQTIAVEECLASAGLARTIVNCRRGEVIFRQGDHADSIMRVQNGMVKLALSGRREGIVGILGSDDFFGEECLAGHSVRTRTATALTQSTVLVIGKAALVRLLRTEPVVADRFMAHLLSRNARVEDDLMDQLLSSCEQRLARTLLILADYDRRGTRKTIVPRISQTTLAGIVGSSRSRINYFLRKFKTLGFIEMHGPLTVHRSLLNVVSPCLQSSLRDRARTRPRPSVVPAGSHRAPPTQRCRKRSDNGW